MNTRRIMSWVGVAAGLVAIGGPVHANESNLPANSYGNVGLMQTPTARFTPAGALRVGFASARPYDSTYFTATPYDWLEASFRYTKFRYSDSDGTFTRDGYLDKSFDFKLRLREETWFGPSIAVGVQDLGGTGLLSSEYLVANKRFGHLDISFGVAWGRQGARADLDSPLGGLSDRFEVRDNNQEEGVGDFELGRLFAGDAAFFGGVRWAPIGSPWSFMIEREGNDYQSEPFGNDLDVEYPVNFGVAYSKRLFGANFGWERGDQFVFGFRLALDLADPGPPKYLDPLPTPVAPPSAGLSYVALPAEGESVADARMQDIIAALERQNIPVIRLAFTEGDETLIAWVGDSPYRQLARRHGRVARVLAVMAPEATRYIEIAQVSHGLEQTRVRFVRDHVQLAAGGVEEPGYPLKWASFKTPALEPIAEDPAVHRELFDLDWTLTPKYRQSFGDPDDSYRAGLYLALGLTKWWTPHLVTSAVGELAVATNLDDIERESDSVLPRVRSDIAQYQREGADGLRQLEVNYIRPLTSELFVRGSAGIFEEMYGGVAAEVLYRPFAENWAVGANINRVKQRGFDQQFSFRDYEVTTGHVTLYHYFYPLAIESEVSVGRYLAGDVGGTVSMARVFDSGARIGVFATKTDVSSEEFGEGSFDKGFFFSIPLDLLLPKSTRLGVGASFRPLTRDGGQKVRDGRRLYDVTQDRDYLEIVRTRRSMFD